MTEPTRLFECPALHLENNPLPDMLAGKENGTYRTWSTREVNDTIHQLSIGLLRSGISGENRTVEGMDKVGIISKNRPEWVIVDAAVQQTGAVLTPVYPTLAVGELEFILNDAQVKTIFVNDEELFHKVLSVKDRVPSLREIYSFEHVVGATTLEGTARDAHIGGRAAPRGYREDHPDRGSGNDNLYLGDYGSAKGGNAFAPQCPGTLKTSSPVCRRG